MACWYRCPNYVLNLSYLQLVGWVWRGHVGDTVTLVELGIDGWCDHIDHIICKEEYYGVMLGLFIVVVCLGWVLVVGWEAEKEGWEILVLESSL